MLVRIKMDGMGCLTLTPVNDKWRERFATHLRKYYSEQADGTAFLQSDDDVEAFLESLPKGKSRSVRQGWTAAVRMDPWVYGHYLGWDAHTVAE